jgi:hypothetical protein
MKWLGFAAVLAMSISMTACSGSSDPFSDSCTAMVRHQGIVYVEVGFSKRHVAPAGHATIVACATDPEATRVDAGSFEGYSSTQVVAVRQHGDVYRVFVSERLGEGYVKSLHDAHLLNAGDE